MHQFSLTKVSNSLYNIRSIYSQNIRPSITLFNVYKVLPVGGIIFVPKKPNKSNKELLLKNMKKKRTNPHKAVGIFPNEGLFGVRLHVNPISSTKHGDMDRHILFAVVVFT